MLNNLTKNEYTDCICIIKDMQKAIKGRIYFTVDDNKVTFHIHGQRGIKYRHLVEIHLLSILNIYELANRIIKCYENFVLKEFFNNKE